MVMDPKCIAAVRAAAGSRQVSDAKLALIEDAIKTKASELATRDTPRWLTLTTEQRTLEAATAAMQDVTAAAARKEATAGLQVLATDRVETRIKKAQELNGLTRSQGYIRVQEQASNDIAQIRGQGIGSLGDLLDAATKKDGTGLLRNLGIRFFEMDNPLMTRDIIREVFKNADGSTGNRAAQAGARAWLDTIERMRTRFNNAGGNIGKLWYGYLGQAHDAVRVFKAGADAWAEKVLPLLDRKQYLAPDGTQLPDEAVRGILSTAWKTITTGGDSKTEPGAFKTAGATANHGTDHRVLHFADGDAWAAYMKDFGEGSLYDSMTGHIGRMARDIGLVENMGPNPAQQHRLQADIARREDVKGQIGDLLSARSAGNTPDGYWQILSGASGMPENRPFARGFSDLRNVHTASKIVWGPLTGTADIATIMHTLHFNRLPYFEMLRNIGKQFSKETRETMQSHSIVAESLASTINRWTGDNLTHSVTGKTTAAVMKASWMNAWTDGLRTAYAHTMMAGWARMAQKDWGALDEWDRYLLQRKGVTEADWKVVQQAKSADTGDGYMVLSPQAIRDTGAEGADQVATRVLGAIIDEAQFAVVNPDMATRAVATWGGMPAGTVKGEIARSVAQFASFPMAMMTRHWRRIGETPQGLQGAPLGFRGESGGGALTNKIAMLAMLGVTTTLLGGVQIQLRDILSGKDPMDPTGDHWVKFWAKAFASGGGAGTLANILLNDPTAGGVGTWQNSLSLFGPIAGDIGSLGDLSIGNAKKYYQGKETHTGAEALRFASSHIPGAWQGRLLYNNLFLYDAQEALNPGYLGRMTQRAQKETGQSYWWEPGDHLPSRAPDFGAAIGMPSR